MAFRLKRRTFLRGTGTIAVALPVLECMLDSNGEALAAGGGDLPCRYAMVVAGQSIGGDDWAKNENRLNGMNFDEDGHFIAPAEIGSGYTVTTPLQPLHDLGLQDDFSIVSNMRIPYNATNSDPSAVPAAGAYREFHGGGKSPLFSGTRSQAGSYVCNGITADQMIANNNAGAAAFDSLVFRSQPSWYLAGSSFSGRQYVSYRGAADPIEAQVSPQIAYMSLFGNFTPDNAGDIAILDFSLRSRRSVLDLVNAKRQELTSKVGMADRKRLEDHFDELRDLEDRLATIDPQGGACSVPADPGQDPAIGGDNSGSGSGDIGSNTGYSEEFTRSNLLSDMIAMAFACDLTRVATLQITVFQSHMNATVPSMDMGTPITADLHEVGHNGDENNRGQVAVSTMLKWHTTQYAYLLNRLKELPEGNGTVLDNTVALFVPTGGHGTQLDDAVSTNQAHSVEEMCMIVGGHAGGLAAGQHIRTNGAHPAQCLISAMQAAGNEGDTLGEVTGNIPELFVKA